VPRTPDPRGAAQEEEDGRIPFLSSENDGDDGDGDDEGLALRFLPGECG